MTNIMKRLFTLQLIALLVLVVSCRQNPADQRVTAAMTNDTISQDVTLNAEMEKKIGSWVKKGTECYGIVVGYFADGSTIGKSVKCKVVAIKPDKVRMKTIESVKLLEGEGCDKMGLAYGDTWWEEEGDIFRTREEADAFLKEKGWLSTGRHKIN